MQPFVLLGVQRASRMRWSNNATGRGSGRMWRNSTRESLLIRARKNALPVKGGLPIDRAEKSSVEDEIGLKGTEGETMCLNQPKNKMDKGRV